MKVLNLTTLFGASLSMLVILSGCSTKKEELQSNIAQEMHHAHKSEAECFNNLPKSVAVESVAHGIGAVGIARYTKAGPAFMVPIAENRAKLKLAGYIYTEASGLDNDALRLSQVSQLDNADTNFRRISEFYIKRVGISGAYVVKKYQNPCSGDMYVKVAIDFKQIADNLSQNKDTFKKAIEQSNLSRDQIEQGMKTLDKNIDRLRARENQ